ncbi:MAG: cation:proton antiporter, partial [Rhodospirillales bacterium]
SKPAMLAVAVIFILGRLLLRPLFKLVAVTRIPELFVAMTLLAIIGTAWLTGLSGLSMALGAFLAGLLIAETEFRHQVEIDIQPFKGLLLGVFFLSVGMGIDFTAVADRAGWVVASVFGLLVIKAVLAGGMCWAFGVPKAIAFQAGLYLSQAGEFAFVTVGLAVTLTLIPAPVGQFMLIVASLTMVVTPLIALLARRLGARLFDTDASFRLGPGDDAADLEGHVVIAGFGRVGQTVAKLLDRMKIPYVAIDIDARLIATCRRENRPVFFGDARRAEVLARVGTEHARALVVTLDDAAAASRAIGNIRARWPDLLVYARARDMAASGDLAELGVTQAVPETVEASLQLAGQLLGGLGVPPHTVGDLIGTIRQNEYASVGPVIGPAIDSVIDPSDNADAK